MRKAPEAFRTISETAEALDTPAHVLRFWESKFTQVKPVKRAGGRRYYRRADIDLLSGIKELLHEQGMTIRGVQKLLQEKGVRHVAALAPVKDMTLADDPGVPAGSVPTPPVHLKVVTPHQTQDTAAHDSTDMPARAGSPVKQPQEPTPAGRADAAKPDTATPQAAKPAPVADAPPRKAAEPVNAVAAAPVPNFARASQVQPTGAAQTPPRAVPRTSIRLAHDLRRHTPHATPPDPARIAPLVARLEQLLARMTAQAEQGDHPHHPR